LLFPLAADEDNQLQQICNAKGRPTRCTGNKLIRCHNVCPARRQASDSASIIVKVDAVFTPRIAAIDQREFKSAKRMKRMGDPKELPPLYQILCS